MQRLMLPLCARSLSSRILQTLEAGTLSKFCPTALNRNVVLREPSHRPSALSHCFSEALSAVSVALLTIYDMCKAVDRRMVMGGCG